MKRIGRTLRFTKKHLCLCVKHGSFAINYAVLCATGAGENERPKTIYTHEYVIARQPAL